ncbi:MAG TPA: hypothetical protein DFR83_03385 [Deltaproteobacteria bacterium]|nr:hypothetical protein [Deltaproteobacteria bacterium]
MEGSDKEPVYGRALERNSMDFAMQRLAASAFLHHERGPGDEPDTHSTLNPTSQPRTPLAAATPERRALAAQLTRLTNRLRSTRSLLLEDDRRPPAEWYHLMRTLLDGFTQTGASTSFLTREVEDTLQICLHPAPSESIPGALSLEELRQAVRDRFERPLSVKADFGAAVRVQRLRPGGIPARPLVIFLGLGSGSYPRRPRRPSWWPKPSHKVPSTDGILLQRQAFAEAILAAESEVWLSWTARELNKGGELPPSSLVGELEDLLSLSDAAQEACRAPAGRHPWSETAPVSLDVAGWAARTQMAPPRSSSTEPDRGHRLPSWTVLGTRRHLGERPKSGPTVEALPVYQLVSELLSGAKTLQYKRLGVYLSEEEAPLPAREPMGASGLDRYALREECFVQLQAHLPRGASDEEREQALEAVLQRIMTQHQGVGDLALGPTAEGDIRNAASRVLQVVDASRTIYGTVERDVSFSWRSMPNSTGAQVELSCRVPMVFARTVGGAKARIHQWVAVSKSKQTIRQKAWIALCMARLSDQPAEGARIVVDGACEWLVPRCEPHWTFDLATFLDRQALWMGAEGAEFAARELERRVLLRTFALRSRIPLFKKTSMAAAEAAYRQSPTKTDSKALATKKRAVATKAASIRKWQDTVAAKKAGSKGRQNAETSLQKAINAHEVAETNLEALLRDLDAKRHKWLTQTAPMRARKAAANQWYTDFMPGEEDDPWNQRIFSDYDPILTLSDDPALHQDTQVVEASWRQSTTHQATFIEAAKLLWESLLSSHLTDGLLEACADMAPWRSE